MTSPSFVARIAVAMMVLAGCGRDQAVDKTPSCRAYVGAASIWLEMQQLGDMTAGQDSEAAKFWDRHRSPFKYDMARSFEAWCKAQGPDAVACFDDISRSPPSCKATYATLLAQRLIPAECARVLPPEAAIVLALEDLGTPKRFYGDVHDKYGAAESKYAARTKSIDVANLCWSDEGVRLGCLVGVDGDDCARLRKSLRAQLAPEATPP